MENNIFLLSDASYSDKSKVSGLGIVDTFSGIKYKSTVFDLNNSFEAEFYALALSIKIAIKNDYSNVVFVYDCKGLIIDELKSYAINKFVTVQFLWLKREYLKDADALANKARKLTEKLKIKSATEDEKELLVKKSLNMNIIKTFKSCDMRKKILAIQVIANDREKEVLDSFLSSSNIKTHSNKGKVLGLGTKKRTLMKFTYYVLNSNDKIDFLKYLSYLDPNLNPKTFKKSIKETTINALVMNILNTLKKQKKEEKE